MTFRKIFEVKENVKFCSNLTVSKAFQVFGIFLMRISAPPSESDFLLVQFKYLCFASRSALRVEKPMSMCFGGNCKKEHLQKSQRSLKTI